jgi:aminoglycoside 6'-N-acetyltransferase
VSDILLERGAVAVRLMQDAPADYEQLAHWLTDERVLEFYEGRDNPFPLERIVEKYSPRVLGADDVTPCFILHEGRPVGYIQYYIHDEEEKREYGFGSMDTAYGMDMFIGAPELWNQGIGTQVVSLMRDYLFETLRADVLTLDPETWNTRAIRCYEKCGFRKTLLLLAHEMHEGKMQDSWLMTAHNPKPKSPDSVSTKQSATDTQPSTTA